MNTVTKQDKQKIINHFAIRLYQRYGVYDNPLKLQQTFKSFVINKKAIKLQTDKRDRNKAFYVTKYKGKKILFVYNNEIKLVKTALVL